ncbi:SDR family oxidoreductase [Hydrogenophaga sp.]|uniref:SDR family NAD(P)-dependent oxidoreductase n=1 Tax=Hydrogenophaga sp. TaxID=1904254 RepID=UPI00262D8FB5|nr:SDR family oxidoreductase [Hydrogenophaga sp.]MCW5654348.1 SDR family oxidoreductase [Hydrogenophaga sp.]
MTPSNRLDARVAVITGAAGGLGAGIARHLARLGAHLALLEPRGESLDNLIEELRGCGATVQAVACDVTDESAVARAAQTVLAQQGRCDILVNNAGILVPASPLEKLSLSDWNRSMAVNLTGVLLCTQSFGRAMLRQASGSIINIGSIGAQSPNTSPPYSVTKAGVLALTRHTAVEWGPMGVRTNSVSPGFLRTPLSEVHYANPDMLQLRTQVIPVRRLGTADDIAAVVAFLASDAAAFVNGQDIVADGGFLHTTLMHVHKHADQYGGTHQADLSPFARLQAKTSSG